MDEPPTTHHSPPTTPIHTIRLRHPWQCETADGAIVWSRKFNWPAELSPGEVVQLVIESVDSDASVMLNGNKLPADTAERRDVTALLSRHNRLEISSAAGQGEPAQRCPYDVRLEISGG